MKVAILYSQDWPDGPEAQSRPDCLDTLDQAGLIEDSLVPKGHKLQRFALKDRTSFMPLLNGISEFAPDVVFNLVESIYGKEELHPSMAGLLEILNIHYTGSPLAALASTTDKAVTKAVLAAAGLPTAPWNVFTGHAAAPERELFPGPWIVKPACADASIGIDDDAVVTDFAALLPKAAQISAKFGKTLIERFIDGREFNISVLEKPGSSGTAEVMPPAEMEFANWPEGKPRIVNYKAKWDEAAFEYENTVRSFPSADENTPINKMKRVALACWDLFGLRGYARVDMRLDAGGGIYIMEINANPCIAPWSGFMAASKQGGYEPGEVIQRIVLSALGRNPY